jgi:1,4-alpha-glucan branching enzyme
MRSFFIQNALCRIQEYAFDGLRLDAVHAILGDSPPDVLSERAADVQAGPNRHRPSHPIPENDRNAASCLTRDDAGTPRSYTAAIWSSCSPSTRRTPFSLPQREPPEAISDFNGNRLPPL